jgi:membrane protein implicated in regulation of membrane protease activity
MDWGGNAPWLIWLAVALGFGLAEILTVDFVFLMLAGGALTAAGVAGVSDNVPAQVVAFAVAAGVLLVLARPPLRRWARRTPELPMNTRALIGRTAVVLATVTEHAGEVKLAGETWSARTVPGGRALEPGSTVHVHRIAGATVVVGADPASESDLEERS